MSSQNSVKPMVLEFKKQYPYPNLSVYKNHPEVYELTLIGLHFSEFNKGYKVVEISKPTDKGIELIFRPFLDKKDIENYLMKIKVRMNCFNIKNEI